MLRSMTAFGRAAKKTVLGYFSIEIQSVNRKHLEINIVLPPQFSRFESEIRKQVAAKVFRGHLTLKIAAVAENESPISIKPNLVLLMQYKAAWDKIAQELNIPANNEIFFNLIPSDLAVFIVENEINKENEFLDCIKDVLDKALQNFLKMKEEEGVALQNDIISRYHKLKQYISLIALKAPAAVQRYRQKLIDRLAEIATIPIEGDERVLKEIAIYADKVDISEEIIRFESHLQQFYELIKSSTESIGKTLEFIIQELNREINTIASKSSDIEVSRLVIESKSEIEKTREQLQNIE